MYKKIFHAYQALSKGDRATLQRCNLTNLANSPAYFRVLKISGVPDNAQTQRILFLFVNVRVTDDAGVSVAQALINAGVKEQQVIQIQRSGDNGIEYLKRQLIRCDNVSFDDLGKLAQYWGPSQRRELLKNFIIHSVDSSES